MSVRPPWFAIAFLLAALTAAGCSQQQWLWNKPKDGGTPAAGLGAQREPGGLGLGAKSGGDPSLKDPLSLARLSERRGQTEQAAALYQEVLRRAPHNPVPYHRLAVMYAKRGNFKEADRCFAQALTLKADDPNLLSDMGYCSYLSGRLEEAEKHLRRAVELDPNNTASWNNLALVVGEQGRYDECLALFRRVGTDNQAYANLAFVFAQRGEYQRALDTYNRVLTQDPKMRTAAEAMIQLSKAMADRQPPAQTAAPPPPERTVAYHQPLGSQQQPMPATYEAVVDTTRQPPPSFAPPQAAFMYPHADAPIEPSAHVGAWEYPARLPPDSGAPAVR